MNESWHLICGSNFNDLVYVVINIMHMGPFVHTYVNPLTKYADMLVLSKCLNMDISAYSTKRLTEVEAKKTLLHHIGIFKDR